MSAKDRGSPRGWIRRLYFVAIVLKALDGAVETISGGVFLFFSKSALHHWIFHVTAPELTEDPDDFVANLLRRSFSHLSAGTKIAAGAYLLGHGIIKILLVAALLRRQRWAFFCGFSLLLLSGVWEAVRCAQTHSLAMGGALAFDVAILALVWREYRHGEFRRR